MTTRADALPPATLYVGGEWATKGAGGVADKYDPATGRVLAEVPVAGPDDVDAAVAAARAAFPAWRALPVDQRRTILLRVGDLLRAHADEFALLASLESGLPRIATDGMPGLAAEYFTYYAGWADKLAGQVLPVYPGPVFDYTRIEPYGVVGVLIPWNGPTVSLGQKVAPALAAGNCVVLKPTEVAPFTSLRFAQLCEDAGLPAGVLNVVPGGAEAGAALVAHPGVDKISFTGAVETGKRVQAGAAANLTPVTLELGGKSANLVFADADLDSAFGMAIFAGAIGAAGEGCVCPTRLLVEASVYERAVESVAGIARSIVPGDPIRPDTLMGPVITEAACRRILGVIDRAVQERAGELVAGGGRVGADVLGPDLAGGYFLEPTVFAGVDNRSHLAQEEVFGPVLAVIPFEDEAEALALANDSPYGLAGYVWTNDLRRAHRVAANLEVGYVSVNGMAVCPPTVPFGGVKASGYGREGGLAGIMEFVHVKNVYVADAQ